MPGSPPVPGAYSRYGAKNSAPSFTCPCCGQHPPLRSNQAIHDEYQRLAAYLTDQSDPACPNDTCASLGVTLSAAPGSYAKFGTTAGGSIRWKCKTCGKVFTQGAKATKRQLITHRNKDVFSLLVNKMPMRRICEVTGLGLARGPVELEKILAFDPMAKHRCSPKASQKAEGGKKSSSHTDWLQPEEELII